MFAAIISLFFPGYREAESDFPRCVAFVHIERIEQQCRFYPDRIYAIERPRQYPGWPAVLEDGVPDRDDVRGFGKYLVTPFAGKTRARDQAVVSEQRGRCLVEVLQTGQVDGGVVFQDVQRLGTLQRYVVQIIVELDMNVFIPGGFCQLLHGGTAAMHQHEVVRRQVEHDAIVGESPFFIENEGVYRPAGGDPGHIPGN